MSNLRAAIHDDYLEYIELCKERGVEPVQELSLDRPHRCFYDHRDELLSQGLACDSDVLAKGD